jgi:hypothetical protein
MATIESRERAIGRLMTLTAALLCATGIALLAADALHRHDRQQRTAGAMLVACACCVWVLARANV